MKDTYKDNEKSFYRVRTKSAVAGVRGTEFLTSFDAKTKLSHIVTFRGQVAVGSNQAGVYKPNVIVKAGYYTRSGGGMSPHFPQKLSPKKMAQINKETKIDSPSHEQRGVAHEKEMVKKKEKNKEHNKGPHKDKTPQAPKKKPKNLETPSREPSSLEISGFEEEINKLEDSILHNDEGSALDLEMDEIPDPTKIVDGTNIQAPQIKGPDLINNVIQNPKANVQINIGVE